MKAFLAILCCVILGIPIVFLTVLTRPQREAILTDIRSQWLRRVEPNMLNRILLSKDSDPSVVLPVSADGVVLSESDECDLHVAINRDRHISIHGARISRDQLVAIIAYRLDRYRGKPPRVFLWADLSLPSEQVSEWVRLFHEAGCLPVYCVVATGSPVTRRAVLCEPNAAVQTFPITATNTVFFCE